jgi:hypothetical protein
MSLDFESDISPKIRFLVDLGIRPEDLGYIFTYNPDFFKLDPGKKKSFLMPKHIRYTMGQNQQHFMCGFFVR